MLGLLRRSRDLWSALGCNLPGLRVLAQFVSAGSSGEADRAAMGKTLQEIRQRR